MSAIFARALPPDQMPQFVDNLDWLATIDALDFLGEVGKHFPVGEMIRRESVRRRPDDDSQGISYTEFSYGLLQAYDFMRLCADWDVTVQLGASDQWGNIIAGDRLHPPYPAPHRVRDHLPAAAALGRDEVRQDREGARCGFPPAARTRSPRSSSR